MLTVIISPVRKDVYWLDSFYFINWNQGGGAVHSMIILLMGPDSIGHDEIEKLMTILIDAIFETSESIKRPTCQALIEHGLSRKFKLLSEFWVWEKYLWSPDCWNDIGNSDPLFNSLIEETVGLLELDNLFSGKAEFCNKEKALRPTNLAGKLLHSCNLR